MGYLVAILALAVLCGLWGGLQLWLAKAAAAPEGEEGGSCSACPRPCGQERTSGSHEGE